MDILVLFGISILVLLLITYFIWHSRCYIYAWWLGFPSPRYKVVVERNVMVPMLDGTKLATDIFRPKTPRRNPVLLIRTPYNKMGSVHPYKKFAEIYASQGYVVVLQDVRGKYGSEGKFFPYVYEALDGNTTVTWAGEAPWSDGRVAMLGISYLGSCAWLASKFKNPYLRALIVMFTNQNTYSIWEDNGTPYLKGPLFWISQSRTKIEDAKITHKGVEPYLWHLPTCELDQLLTGNKISFYQACQEHIQPDAFWDEISVEKYARELNIPVYLIGGWYDPYLSGMIKDYQRMLEAPENSKNHFSRLEIGPWRHVLLEIKELKLGKDAYARHLFRSTLRWCDLWLKDKSELLKEFAPVRYFLLGKNEWRNSETWPPEGGNTSRYYLGQNEKDQILSASPMAESIKKEYVYNPRDPVFFRGSHGLEYNEWITPIEQDDSIIRDDVLIFNSEPFIEELTVIGDVKLILHVSSEAVDTDFCAKICNVPPNGKAYALSVGFLRMRFRDSLLEPKLMEPFKIYRLEIPFRPIANVFLKGHRLQLQITSSDFPLHNRNLNTGQSCETTKEILETKQTIYLGGIYDSHLVLNTY